MDGKIAMNVEFLRARLLSERIVSKTARDRAEMLSQRVIELEEQLRIVNIQRKKAEKAAEEVLSILETQGITCVSGLTDSSSDEENNRFTDQEGSQCIITEDVKEDKSLASSRMDRSEIVDGLSCSDIDGSPSVYHRLSWKSRASSLDSQEKVKTKQNRHKQRSSFVSTLKSSPRRPGKSCRKIKRSDVGSASENELQKPSLLHAHEDGIIAHSDDFDEKHECPLEAFETKMNKYSADSSSPFCSNGRNREIEDGGEKNEMERALEEQAQLITQFQAMENAQKEWEEKFKETKMSLLDNHEPVNVVENFNRSADNSKHVGSIPRHEEEEEISVKDISFTEDKNGGRCKNCEISDKKVTGDNFPNGTSPSSQHSSNSTNKGRLEPSLTESKELYAPDNKKNLRGYEKPEIRQEQAHGLMEQANHAAQVFTIPSRESSGLVLSRKDLKGSVYQKQGILHTSSAETLGPITNETIARPICTSLGSVLHSLQRARISIKDELVRRPSSAQGSTLTIPAPANFPLKPNVPIDSSVLFRLPSDSYPQALSGANLYGSGLRLTATRLDLGTSNKYLNQFSSASYSRAGSKVSSSKDYGVRYHSSSYIRAQKVYTNHNQAGFVESESPISNSEQHFDQSLRLSLSASSPGRYPLYFPDLSSERLSSPLKSSSELRIRKPYSDGYNYGRTAPSPI